MKFGKRIGNEAEAAGDGWQRHYVDYKVLKKLLKRLASEAEIASPSLEAEEEAFRRSIFAEIDKVHPSRLSRVGQFELIRAEGGGEDAHTPCGRPGAQIVTALQVDHFFAEKEADLYTE